VIFDEVITGFGPPGPTPVPSLRRDTDIMNVAKQITNGAQLSAPCWSKKNVRLHGAGRADYMLEFAMATPIGHRSLCVGWRAGLLVKENGGQVKAMAPYFESAVHNSKAETHH